MSRSQAKCGTWSSSAARMGSVWRSAHSSTAAAEAFLDVRKAKAFSFHEKYHSYQVHKMDSKKTKP